MVKEFEPTKILKDGDRMDLLDKDGNVEVKVTRVGVTLNIDSTHLEESDTRAEDEALAFGMLFSKDSQEGKI